MMTSLFILFALLSHAAHAACGRDHPSFLSEQEAQQLAGAFKILSTAARPPARDQVQPGTKLPYDMFEDYITYHPIFFELNTKACTGYVEYYAPPTYKIDYVLDLNVCRVVGHNKDGSKDCDPFTPEQLLKY
jgi:hypothetical protein